MTPALEQAVLHGLMAHWVEEVRYLFGHSPPLQPPVFALREFERRWGQWSPDHREIAIRKRLVTDFPWRCVRDVLRHEMAHQYVDEVLGGENQPHGPLFREACKTFRADPRAAGDFEPLRVGLPSPERSPEDRMMVKVQKLFALGESPNLHEAEAAMQKAHQLIRRHNLSLTDDHRPRDYLTLCIGDAALRHPGWRSWLAGLLSEFYGVYCIWIPMYVLPKAKMGTILEISGTGANVKIASYVHDFVAHYITSRWQTYRLETGVSHHRRNDFAVGILRGFREKLVPPGNDAGEHALVPMNDPGLRTYVQWRYPRVANRGSRSRSVDPSVLRAGERVGRNLVLAKGVEARPSLRGLQLGA